LTPTATTTMLRSEDAATSEIDRLPDAVVARLMSLLDSVDHSACARLATRFRRLAAVRASCPASVRVRDSPDRALLGRATPALWSMRPTERLEIVLAPLPPSPKVGAFDSGGGGNAKGVISGAVKRALVSGAALRLLVDQPHMRQLVIIGDEPIDPMAVDTLVHQALGPTQPLATSNDDEAANLLMPVPLSPLSSPPPFSACVYFRTSTRVSSLVAYLLRRMPNLAELECEVLPLGALLLLPAYNPELAVLIVESGVGGRMSSDAWTALSMLPRLRRLELPHLFMRTADLARMPRLEALRVAAFLFDVTEAPRPHESLKSLTTATQRLNVRFLMPRFPALTVARLTVADRDSRLVLRLAHGRVSFHWIGVEADAHRFLICDLAWSALGALHERPTDCDFDPNVPLALKRALTHEFARFPPLTPPPPPTSQTVDASDSDSKPSGAASEMFD
jgi:hypothetical protein